jgi:hypothetical protein
MTNNSLATALVKDITANAATNVKEDTIKTSTGLATDNEDETQVIHTLAVPETPTAVLGPFDLVRLKDIRKSINRVKPIGMLKPFGIPNDKLTICGHQ